MSTAVFLKQLRELGIHVRAANGKLICSAPKTSIGPDLNSEIRQRKDEILNFLASAESLRRGNRPPLRPLETRTLVPLSYSQRRLWFIEQLDPGSRLYNLPAAFRLKGELDVAILRRAIFEIIRRHEILRTVFRLHDGDPVQVVRDSLEIDVPLKRLPYDFDDLREYLAEQSRVPLSLTEGPLFRAELIELGAKEHVLFFVTHHIVWDGWSFDVFLSELRTLYEAFLAGEASPLPELPVQYLDYSVWQKNWLEGGELEHQLAYWRNKLAGELTTLQLNTDYPRPPIRSIAGARYIHTAPQELADSLIALAKKEGATLYMVLLAAYKTLLHRLTGQDDLIVGAPMASNSCSETEGMIGFFVNTIVLRSDLSGEPSFLEALRRVRETCLTAINHQDVPFEKLVEHLQVPRDRSRTPIHQTEFGFQEASQRPSRIGALEVEQILVDQDVAGTDLMFWINFDGNGLPLAMNYSTKLYAESTIQRLLKSFENLLYSIVRAPDAKITDLEVLDQPQLGELLEFGRGPQIEPDQALCLHQLIEHRTARFPQAPALVHHDEKISYEQLNRRANQLADKLIQLGIGPDSLVGICMDRSPRLVASLVAAHKAGGAYLPLDPTYPLDRISYMVADSGTRVILTERKYQALFGQSDAAVVYLDELEPELADLDASNPTTTVRPSNLAYVIYTSGSTGKPKGVMIQHDSAQNFIHGMAQEITLDHPGVWLAVTSISFDISVLEIFGSLAHGFCVVIYDGFHAGKLKERESIPSLIQRHGVTHFQCTPSQASMLIADSSAQQSVAQLSQLLVGGEALPLPLAEQLSKLCTGDVFNMYGPTETTVWSAFHQLGAEENSIPIGTPLANQTVYLLDSKLRPVPRGCTGEVFIAGKGLARGYHNRPDLTAERFLQDPFAAKVGGRMYRTGDLARFRLDGRLEFLGRSDGQIKLRGHRIELGEIESAISAQPEIQSAAVIVREDSPGDQRLAAYCVLAEGMSLDAKALRESLRQSLPAYMLPAAFVQLDALPMTPNGKVDRKALPAPAATGEEVPARREPINAREREILELWREVLGVEDIGVEDDFFELGGHSLLLPKLLAMLREKTGLQIDYGQLYEHTSIAGLASALSGEEVAHVRILPRAPDAPMRVTSAQRRLWFLSRLTPDTGVYNVWQALNLRGDLDRDLLQRSLQQIVQRHELLRSQFGMDDKGQPFPVVHASLPVEIASSKLSKDEATAYLAQRLQEPFDLAVAPLFRCELIEVGAAEHIFAIAMHHAITDARSMAILQQELFETYAALELDTQPTLPELPISFTDYAAWEVEQSESPHLLEQLAWWQETLKGPLPSLDLPSDRPRPPALSYRGDSIQFNLPQALVDRLQTLATRNRASLYMVLLAGFQTLLHRFSGEQDIIIGTPASNRSAIETENLFGLFIDTLALRTQVDSSISFAELIARSRQASLDALAHREVSFDRIVAELDLSRDTSRTPVFQTMFAFNDSEGGYQHPSSLQDLQVSGQAIEFKVARTDLTVWLNPADAGIRGVIEFSSELFDRAFAERVAEAYRCILEAAASDATAKLAELPVMQPASLQNLVFARNETWQDYPRELSIHGRFEQQVDRSPDAIAIRHGAESLSYAELDQRANQMAQHLISLGVRQDSLVGICSNRNLDMLAGMLGILKAGAAYVPLDPDYPRERLQLMLDDSAAEIVIAEQSLQDLVADGKRKLISFDDVAKENCERPGLPHVPESLAYVIYTSGSTGKPKGVMVEHRNALNFFTGMDEVLQPTEPGTWVAVTSICFDISVLELFWTLGHGFTIVLHSGVESVADMVLEHRATHLQCTPSQARMVCAEAAAPTALAGLQKMLVGGEALPSDLGTNLLELVGGDTINVYGPTETTIWSSAHRLCHAKVGPIPIGEPIANTSLYILDEQLEPVPKGVIGELYIGGEGVVRGYFKRPDLTAERFLPDPFREGQRMYRSGDLVRYREGWELEFLGRSDGQIKLRGHRIELGEIENAISAQAEIQSAAVIVREDSPGDQRLTAYCVLAEGMSLDAKALRESLRQSLPAYMLPAAFVQLDALPMTPNGKVDRKALPAPAATGEEVPARREPINAREREILELWREVLGVEDIGVEDDFFELGGHSLLLPKLLAMLREKTGLQIDYGQLYEHTSIAGLASALSGEEVAHVRILPRAPDAPMRVTSAQRRLWFLSRLTPDTGVYNVWQALNLRGDLDRDLLQRSLQQIVQRHELLRSQFGMDDKGQPFPVVHASLPVEIASSKLSKDEATAYLAQRLQEPFDLAVAPLFRCELIQVGAAEHIFAIAMHHAITDARSMAILQQELFETYAALELDTQPTLPELPISFTDYAAWEVEQSESPHLLEQLAWWQETLKGPLPSLDLPSDRPRPPALSYRGDSIQFNLPQALVDRLQTLATQNRASLYMVLLAGFQTLLHRFSGEQDIIIGTPASNRSAIETENLFGLFIDTLALRTQVDSSISFAELIARSRQASLDALAHREVSFDRIVAELDLSRDTSRTPVFQTMFAFNDSEGGYQHPSSLQDLQVSGQAIEFKVARTDLTVWLNPADAGIRGVIEFSSELFDRAFAERVVEAYRCILEAAASDATAKLAELPVMQPASLQNLVFARNETWQDYPRELSIHGRFEQQVDRSPDAIAIRHGAESLSYAELDQRANQMAQHLISLGVRQDSLVGICSNRNLDLLAGMLGILKAGAAYVPLDPDYPRERLQLMLDDSAAEIVIAERSLQDLVADGKRKLISFDDVAKENCERPGLQHVPESLAYVIYTSGSTGKPKGVMVEHRNALNFFTGMDEVLQPTEPGTWVAVTSICFDISVLELFWTLGHGFTIVLHSGVESVADMVLEHRATHLQCTPSQARMVCAEAAAPTALAGLQKMLVGGEALPPDLGTNLLELVGGDTINVYGPTETTIWSSAHRLCHAKVGPIPIGEPIANTSLYILDEQLEPVPKGVIGELYIGGEGVVRGYFKRPDLTAERFLPDPFREGQRMYRSGDLVRYREDWSLEFLGRSDGQIKLRGHRIELGEIESVLNEVGGIEQSIAQVVDTGARGPQIAAYYVGETNGKTPDLRDFLRQRLPAYMVPLHVFCLESMPLTPNGKIDRKALPAPEEARPRTYEVPVDFEPSENPLHWFWQDKWIASPVPEPVEEQALQWLVFLDEEGIGDALVGRLRSKGQAVTTVRPSDFFHEENAAEYCINPELGRDQYDSLLESLLEHHRLPERILHLWNLTATRAWRPGSSFYHRSQERGCQSLLFLSQALDRLNNQKPTKWLVVSNGIQTLHGESPLHPVKATSLGPCLLLPREFKGNSTSSLDIEITQHRGHITNFNVAVEEIHRELMSSATDEIVAYREGRRWVKTIEQIELPPSSQPSFHKAGAYLIIGQSKSLTLPLARSLAEHFEASVAVVESAPLALAVSVKSASDHCDSETARESDLNGLHIRQFKADPANFHQMRELIAAVRRDMGSIDGVILAEDPPSLTPLASYEDEEFLNAFAPKVQVLRVLEKLFRDADLDFVATYSSTDPVVARPGSAASVAGDAFAQAFCSAMSASTKTKWISLGWSPLKEERDRILTHQENASYVGRDIVHAQARGIKADRGLDCLKIALESGLASSYVSPIDLETYDRRLRSSLASDMSQGIILGRAKPSTPIEKRMAELWSEVLELEDISIRDNFFDLGGHSLLALLLFTRIADEFNVDWPLATLFEYPTIEALCQRLVSGTGETQFQYLVNLHAEAKDSTEPLFIVAGAFGNVLNLRHLAQLACPERPFYGIQARGLANSQVPHSSVQEAAQAYLAEVRKVQPKGPYFLGGFCSGGVIALEMANRIKAEGEEVRLLALLDTLSTATTPGLSMSDRARLQVERIRAGGMSYLAKWMVQRVRWEFGRLSKTFGFKKTPPENHLSYRSDAIFAATMKAMREYELRPYDGKVALFRPPLEIFHRLPDGRMINSRRNQVYDDNGWAPWISDIEIHEVCGAPGDHDGFVLEPDVHDLAAKLRACLSRKAKA